MKRRLSITIRRQRMFRLVLSAFLFLNVLCTAFADNTVVMIYRNDGIVSAFLKSDIDSIRYGQRIKLCKK